ncbi:MAG: STAS domain-containing protein [Chloroflexota bacterium]|nr:STAS domain-containing protein [Chloroflexota bacterium]
MAITVRQEQGKVPVTILSIYGKLDASNYRAVIASAQGAHDQGARDLLIDMSDVPFMSSSGIVALHTIVLIFRGEGSSEPESGWEALHALDRDRSSGVQEHVKLLKPQPRVMSTLEKTGLDAFFNIYDEREEAISSFT